MAQAIFDPISTYADDDLGGSVEAIPVRFHASPKDVFRWVRKPDLVKWADQCPVASGDALLLPVVSYLCLGDVNAAGGEAWFDWRAAPDASEGYANETIALSGNAAAQGFVQTIEQNIAEDFADVVREGGTVPTQRTIDACVSVASKLSGFVAMESTLKYAAFVEESGGISLVIQSEHPGRRVNFRVSPDGRQIAVVAVTSQGHASTNPVRIDDAETLRGWVEWLRKRD